MSEVLLINKITLSSINDAIREKEGSTALIPTNNIASRIRGITTTSNDHLIVSKSISGNYSNDRITSLRDYAFYNCSELEEVSFSKITKVGYSAFTKCTKLQKATFKLVNNIDSWAFSYCSLLTNIYFGYNGVVTLGDTSAFSNVTTGVKIHVRSAYASQYTTATNWSSLIANGTVVIVGDYTD